MEKFLSIKTLTAVPFLLFIIGTGLSGQTPLEVIKTSNQQVLAIYGEHETIDQSMKEEIIRIIESVTDLDRISKGSIQRFCRDLSMEQCQELDRIFKQLLRTSSMNKLGRYRADRFEYLGEEVKGKTVVVKTVAYYEEDSITLDYLMELQDGGWKIVNYITDDVDTVRNYRKQFLRLFARYSFDEVMKRLKDKIKSLEEEDK